METVNTNRYTTLRFLQLEPTTRCNLHCITCLKGQKNVTWHEQDFPISLAEKIFLKIISFKPFTFKDGENRYCARTLLS